MCGIISWQGDFQRESLKAALRAIAHRGPDDSGVFEDTTSGTTLGHVRLSILDLSPLGHQPMVSADGRFVLVYNGEIYNFAELRAPLEAAGVRFNGQSDTEVLLHLLQAEGVAALPRLNGIFALALLDSQTGELLVARDAFGVKPLYYIADDRGFACCSEIKGLLPLLGDLGAVDEVALFRYVTHLWCPGAQTPVRSVHKLEPGEWLRVRDGRIVDHQRWYVQPLQRVRPQPMTAAQATVAVHDALRTAVRRQMVADVPVGAFLSGGLDSSAVVAFAREQAPNIQCFTIATAGGCDAGETDDLPYARQVAKHLGVRLHTVEIDASRMAADIEAMVWQLDEPLADPAPLNVLYISRLARDAGMKVLLSGSGGDDLFTGYRRHLALQVERLWTWLPGGMRRALDRGAQGLDQRSGIGRRLGRLFAGAGLSGDERVASYFAWARRADLLPLFVPDVRKALCEVRAEQPMRDFLAEMPPESTSLQRMLALEQRFFLADHNLAYTDKMSMAAGVEVRVPFLDLDLVELAARIPDRFKQRGRVGKWVLKKAMEPYLPREVIYRPKTGFGAPLRRWMRHELRELLGDMLSEQSLRRRGLFNTVAVQKLIADNDAGRKDAAYTLLSLMCIEIWCRRFLDGGGVRE